MYRGRNDSPQKASRRVGRQGMRRKQEIVSWQKNWSSNWSLTWINSFCLHTQRKFKESLIFVYFTYFVSITIIILWCCLRNNMCYLLSFCFIYWVLWRFSLDCGITQCKLCSLVSQYNINICWKWVSDEASKIRMDLVHTEQSWG